MASRRKARILAFQALYAWDVSKMGAAELAGFPWLEAEKREAIEPEFSSFSQLLIAGTLENIKEVDAALARYIQSSLAQVKLVDLAILRVAAYEILFQKDIAAKIVIDEAIEIAKEYGADESFRFINGVLDRLAKESHVAV